MQEMNEMQVWYLGPEDVLEKEMATLSSIRAQMEGPGWLQSMGSQRVGHDWAPPPTHTHQALW